MTFGPITSNIIVITLVVSILISIPLGIAAIFVKPDLKLVNDEYVMVNNTQLNLGISAIVLFLTPLLFLLFGGTKLLNQKK
jgi:ABC-type antimicrobial peptide transport system permease subunit